MGKTKICFVSSTGGHLAQLLQLQNLSSDYKSFWVTEKSDTSVELLKNKEKYFFIQQDRKQKSFLFKVIINFFISMYILIKERPKVIITTGAGVVVPLCILSKIFNSKVIFIESFAKVDSPTMTGKFLYKLRVIDRMYVQSENLIKFYDKAIFRGTLY